MLNAKNFGRCVAVKLAREGLSDLYTPPADRPMPRISNKPLNKHIRTTGWHFIEDTAADYWRRLTGNFLGRTVGGTIGGAGRFIDTATEPGPGGGLGNATINAANDVGSLFVTPPEDRKPPPSDAPGVGASVSQTAADYGKKLLESLRDPKYAPMIAAPLLGLGAYGIYDSFRNKKRGKRPKFYDENAREF